MKKLNNNLIHKNINKSNNGFKENNLKERKFIKYIPIVIMFLFILVAFFNKEYITVENILGFVPENIMLAFLLLLFLYFVKSVSIVLPIAILHIVSGKIFSVGTGLAVNLIGLIIVFSVPYFIGKFSGESAIEKIKNKYPKINEIDNFKNKNIWFFIFIFRIVKLIPGDLGSMFLGAINTKYIPYIIVSLLVRIPSMVTMTIFGNSIMNPGSPQFIFSILGGAVLFLLSLVLIYIVNKKMKLKKVK